MSWLLREDDVLAAVEERRPGWQTSIAGVVIIGRPGLVQTVTRSAAADLDTAWCVSTEIAADRGGFLVKRVSTLPARRCSLPRFGAGVLVVAPVGSFERWKLCVGDCLEVRGS
ncbi:MAG TPA: hypothetical protein VNF71_06830 [Acidimicrobiales bacterium]|nr:hypothetical protein [Acidimicrobiales bacterium]